MSDKISYQKGLLYLVHLIITADKVIDEDELLAESRIRELENIPDEIYKEFHETVKSLPERKIYENGIDLISECSQEQQKRAFGWLFKISESDGEVHVKEIRFLLYSVKKAGIEFNDVMEVAKSLPSLE